ncbi:MAG TPA: NUDIX domain-containing protein [Gemmatimonadaceae bacterium]|jgi:8-oxo-dGTP diphosphatase|nr:NUDIX domain-containing protein [Gemmatimonadaceae bacterium]
MRDRPSPDSRPTTRPTSLSVDLAVLSPQDGTLAVLVARTREARSRERWFLPWDAPRGEESLADAAARIARAVLGPSAPVVDQVLAFGDNRRHPGDADVSVGFMALVPRGATPVQSPEFTWCGVMDLPILAPRHRAIVDAARESVRDRLDQSPIAFRLLPPTFTLSELQGIYELLLGRRLHKASFRRALQAATLVEPTDEWRSEGRGRPAQLFRYAPKKRRGARRGVRFDLLVG